jgi:transposase-like protein
VSDEDSVRGSTDFKLKILLRVEKGERLAAVADEMGVLRKSIYEWRAAYRALGVAGLNRKRGPKPGGGRKAASARGVVSSGAPSSPTPRAEAKPADDLASAQARIAELERLIGRQQADLHFFREALRLWDAKSPIGDAPISTKSSRK